MQTNNTYILATGSALPGEPIDSETLAQVLNVDADWIDMFIGTKKRHLAVNFETGEQTATLSDLCSQASAAAIKNSGLKASDVDFLVMATSSPDELMPATVNRVADQLGIDQIGTYQLQSGCAGAVQALQVGMALLHQGDHRVGLVVGGDVCIKQISTKRDFSVTSSGEAVNNFIFGDGAGAVVLTKERTSGAIEIKSVINQLVGLGRPPGQIVRWFGAADLGTEQEALFEDYKAIENSVPVMTNEVASRLLETLKWTSDDLAYILPPQLSGRMTDRITKGMGIAKAHPVNCVAETGNCGNGLPFLQLDLLRNLIKSGEKAIGVCIESSKWIKGGFALEAV